MADPSLMSRRKFGQLAAAGACAAVLPEPSRATAEPTGTYALRGQAPVAVAGVARGAPAEETLRAVRAAALAATDFAWLSRGDTVLLKPACNSGNVYPATTDPLAIRAMIGLLKERGAGRVIVADMAGVQFVRFYQDSLRGSTRELMERNGLAKATEEAGGELHAFEEAGWDAFFEDTLVAGGSWKASVMLPAILNEVDHVVLMPRTARHLLAGSTLGLKAAVGWWRHDSRLEYHRDAGTFAEKTADANTVRAVADKQRLVLSSATKVMTTFGPDNGFVAEPETGIVFASPDLVAHDMISLAWLIENRAAMDPATRDGVFDDPNSSELYANLANRMVTTWLGGIGEAFRMERLRRHDLNRIEDDRVLARAFATGGRPTLELLDADGSLPEALRNQLVARKS
ncbi:MAG: DUF362 domain-containing protein [bacterium]|nr:DUF362 domain-containing protein [bacterium]